MENAQLRFAFKVYRRQFRAPVRTSRGLWTAREGILVRLEREDGRLGFGEIAPIESFATETLAGALAWCAVVPERTGAVRLREIPRSMHCCRAAIAAALGNFDRGAEDSPVDAALAVSALLPTGEAALSAIERFAGDGFNTFKLKIGVRAFADESVLVTRLAERLPSGGRLRLDANGGLDVRGAARWLDAAQGWPVEFIEQPLAVEAVNDLVALAEDSSVPVALDESVVGADDIKRWRDRGWRGLFVLKPALAGDPGEWMSEVKIAPDAFVFSSALETNIGTAAGLRCAFESDGKRAVGYGVSSFFEDDGLGGGVAGPRISTNGLSALNPEAVWNAI